MKLTAVLALLLAAGIAWLGPRGLAAAKLRWEIWRLERNPDERYRLAERYFQAGDFEKARVCCLAALQREPSHAPALALRTEVEFILAIPSSTPAPLGYDRYFICSMGLSGASHRQTFVEIETAFARADRAHGEGDLETAEREWRKILEYVKWMPTGIELETRRRQAQDRLDRIAGER